VKPIPARRNAILRVSLRPLIPFLMLFALYVQFHGDYGPGGGFQAGVMFAAAIVLYTLLYGVEPAQKIFRPRVMEALAAGGVFLYGGVGFTTIFLGKNFLDYDALGHEGTTHGQHLGIFLVELGVGVTVTAVMVTLFMLFAGRERRREPRR
jgi:multicomponent Na+:H+ antiporter subunit B